MTAASRLATAMFLAAALAGCAGGDPAPSAPAAIPAPARPAAPPTLTLGEPAPRAAVPPEEVRGTGRFTGAPRRLPALPGDPDAPVELDFANADVRAVADAVLGGMLGLPYAVDPRVQGQVTIRAPGPLPRSEALAAVDAALRAQGAAIVRQGGLWQVVPLAEAAGQAPLSAPGAPGPGLATAVVPVRHVAVAELDRLVRPLVRQGLLQQADPARNVLVATGTARELEALAELVATFDVDWLAGLSFALHTLRDVEPARLERELRAALQLDAGPLRGMVELVPIPRLDALLVAARTPEALERVGEWVRRLDRPGPGGGQLVHFYEVQNGDARDLAAALNRLAGAAGGDTGAGPLDGAAEGNSTSLGGGRGGLPGGLSGSPGAGFAGGTGGGGTQAAGLAAPRPADMGGFSEGAGAEGPDALRGVRVVADPRRNALLVFASNAQYALLQQALARLDAPREQVLVEATIAEVSLTDDLNFGVQWFLDRGSSAVGFSSASNGSVSARFPGFNYAFLTPDTRVVLSALASVTNVEVLSAPRLMVLDNEKARLQVGDQVPVVTQQATGTQNPGAPTVNSVQLRDTGVILEVVPRVSRGGTVVLEVNQEVSSVVPTTTSGIDSPTIQQRKVTSTVSVQDGETVALGGLISTTRNVSGGGVPYLRDVPVLGKLFGSERRNGGRTELLVFLRPVVVRDAAQARAVTDALRAGMGRLGTLAPPPSPAATDGGAR